MSARCSLRPPHPGCPPLSHSPTGGIGRASQSQAPPVAPTRLTATDLGKTISAVVHGDKTNYATASRTSAATAGVARGILKAAVPTISGTVLVGYVLGASTGLWSPGPVRFTYQWKRAGVAITGATASSYTLVKSDLGKTLTVTVRGTKTAYTSTSKTSVATHAV